MAETALIAVDMDISAIHRRLAEMEGATKEEARRIRKELGDAYKQSAKAAENAAKASNRAVSRANREAEREAKRAAREIERSFGEQASAVRGLFSAALGGVGGDLLDLADATDGVSDSMALLGVTLGTLAIAPVIIGEIAQALKDTAQAGIEARNSLEQAGIMVDQLFTPAQIAALEAYEENLFMNQQAAEKLSTELGAKVAPAASKLDDAFLGLRSAGTVLVDVFGGAAAGIASVSEAALMSPISLNPLKFLIQEAGRRAGETKAEMDALARAEQELAVEARNAARALEEQEKFLENSADYLEVLGMNFDTLELNTSKAKTSTRDHAAALKEAEEATSRYQAAVEYGIISVGDATMGFTNLDLSMQGVVENAGLTAEAVYGTNEELARSAALIAGEDGPPLFESMVEGFGQAAEAAALFGGSLLGTLGNLAQLAAGEQQQHEDKVDQLRQQRAESRQTYRDALRDFEENREAMSHVEFEAAKSELAALKHDEDEKRALIREREKEAKKAAREGFKRMQSLQIAAAIIEGLRNAVALTAAYVPVAGPYAPFVATGVAAAQTMTQVQLIKSTPPPKFHFGTTAVDGAGPIGIPGGEVPAVLERGEGVVSRRGMAAPGVPELVDALNTGLQPAARAPVSDAEADMMAQRLNRPYAPHIRGRAEAGRNTFFRGR
jgi:hypothetical protein